jgi:hypothetical protein
LCRLRGGQIGGASNNSRHAALTTSAGFNSSPLEWGDCAKIEASVDARIGLDELCRLRGGRIGGASTVKTATTTVVLEEENPQDAVKEDDYSSSEYAFTLFQKGDGSKTDPDGIPTRYLKMQNNRREQAKASLQSTLSWREENDINTILARPHPKYDVCKSVFPHYFCGRDDSNHVVFLQRPGLINLVQGHANNLTGNDLLFHYVYVMEYLWQVLEPSTDAKMTSVIDLKGITLSILRKRELLAVVQTFCSTMDAHFPHRAHKTLLINAPKWFGTIYKIISPLLRESTKEKITILSKGATQDAALASLLGNCDASSPNPQEGDLPLMPSAEEQELRDFVSNYLGEVAVMVQ